MQLACSHGIYCYVTSEGGLGKHANNLKCFNCLRLCDKNIYMQFTVKCTRYALLIIILFIYDMNTLIHIIENEKYQKISLKHSTFPFSVVDPGVVEGVSSPLIAKK